MAAIYRAEVTLFLFAPRPEDLADPTTGCTYSAFFSAFDDFNQFGIAVTAVPEATALVGYRLRVELYFNASGDPNGWSLISGTNTLTDDNQTFVFPVYTLAIQKNFDDGIVSWVTPLGTQTRNLSSFTNDSSALRPACHGDGIVLPSGTEASGGDVTFGDFYGYRDGAKFLGASLASTDAGTWTATTEYTTGINPAVPNTDSQNADGYHFGFLQSTPPALRAPTRRMRCWDGGDNITEAQNWWVDAVVSPLTGTILAVVVRGNVTDQLVVYRSEDNGTTFSPVVVAAFLGQSYSWPSILVDPRGWVIVFYNNGVNGEIAYAISTTDGRTWGTGLSRSVIDAFTGTITTLINPRFRIDRFGIIHHIHGAPRQGQFIHQRIPTLAEASSFASVVETGIVDFARSDLYFLSRNEVRAFFRKGGTGRLNRSSTWGNSWENVTSHRSGNVRQTTVTDYERGVTHHIWQDTGMGNTVSNQVSPSGGETFTTGLQGLVATTLEPQYPALALGDRGQLFAFLFTGTIPILTLHCYRSVDWGKTWADTGATFP